MSGRDVLLYLAQGAVELEDLTFSLHLSDAQLTAQLTHTHTLTLQSNRAMQPPRRSTPHLREGQLLRGHRQTLYLTVQNSSSSYIVLYDLIIQSIKSSHHTEYYIILYYII